MRNIRSFRRRCRRCRPLLLLTALFTALFVVRVFQDPNQPEPNRDHPLPYSAGTTVRVVPRRRGGANYSWDFVPDELGVPILRLLESGVPFAIDYNNARACLRDKHIVFMGDSLTRYQYLNFIQWLRRGNWTTPVPRLEHPGDWIAPDFDHWNFFYAKSSGVLSAPADGIMEYCDCYRLPNVSSNWEAMAAETVEQRYFRDAHAGLRVSYIQMFAGWPMHGHNLSWLGVDLHELCSEPATPDVSARVCEPQKGCSPGSTACGRLLEPWHWVAQFPDTALDLLPVLFAGQPAPYAVILNQGVWGCPGDLAPALLSASTRLRDVYSRQGGSSPIFYYKPTTATRGYADRATCSIDASLVRTLVTQGGWHTFDAFNATATAANFQPWFDSVHFDQRIYRGLNELFLDDLLEVACAAQ